MSLVNTINLSFDMTKVLTEMEVHGIKINVDTLHQLRDEYQIEMLILNKKLDTMVKEAMGDTPINLDSGEDRSMVMYSCKVRDKNILFINCIFFRPKFYEILGKSPTLNIS